MTRLVWKKVGWPSKGMVWGTGPEVSNALLGGGSPQHRSLSVPLWCIFLCRNEGSLFLPTPPCGCRRCVRGRCGTVVNRAGGHRIIGATNKVRMIRFGRGEPQGTFHRMGSFGSSMLSNFLSSVASFNRCFRAKAIR